MSKLTPLCAVAQVFISLLKVVHLVMLSSPSWSIVTSVLPLLHPLFFYRALRGDFTWHDDALLSLLVDYQVHGWSVPAIISSWPSSVLHDEYTSYHLLIAITLLVLTTSALYRCFTSMPGYTEDSSHQHSLPPLLIPSRTNHRRVQPINHGFDYAYLMVGIPVGWKGTSGSLVSADVKTLPKGQRRRAWFDVDAVDHLNDKATAIGLEHRLRDYLHGQVRYILHSTRCITDP